MLVIATIAFSEIVRLYFFNLRWLVKKMVLRSGQMGHKAFEKSDILRQMAGALSYCFIYLDSSHLVLFALWWAG